jgi:hypothetical protein
VGAAVDCSNQCRSLVFTDNPAPTLFCTGLSTYHYICEPLPQGARPRTQADRNRRIWQTMALMHQRRNTRLPPSHSSYAASCCRITGTGSSLQEPGGGRRWGSANLAKGHQRRTAAAICDMSFARPHPPARRYGGGDRVGPWGWRVDFPHVARQRTRLSCYITQLLVC